MLFWLNENVGFRPAFSHHGMIDQVRHCSFDLTETIIWNSLLALAWHNPNSFVLCTCLMKGLFLVYRLEEDGSLLKEGAVRLSFGALRACSYKTKTEARQQGSASILFKGFIMVFVIVFVDSLALLGIAITDVNFYSPAYQL